MRKLGALLAMLVLLVAAAYGIYWYKVKTSIDDFVKQVAPFAAVSYHSIYAHPDGTIGVDQLEVTPSGGYESFTAATLRIRPGSPMYWLTGGEEPPESLVVSLGKLEQGMESGFFKMLQEQMDQQREADPLYVSPSALACGKVRQFDVSVLRKMGYRSLLMDLDLRYSGNQSTRKLNFSVQANVADVGEMSFDMRISADPEQLRNPMQASGTARLEKFELNYADKGYNKRQAAFCARETGITAKEYRIEHARLYQAWLAASGINIPDSWFQAYQDLQADGARLTLALNPIGGFGAGDMMMAQDPVYLIEKANPAVVVNGKPLPLDGINWLELLEQMARAGSATAVARGQEQVEQAQTDMLISQPVAESVVPQAATPVKDGQVEAVEQEVAEVVAPAPRRIRNQVEQKSFKLTPKDQLNRHLGAQVRIYTYFGRDVSGKLIHVNEEGIRVSQRMAQGMAEFPLEYARIQEVEVYR